MERRLEEALKFFQAVKVKTKRMKKLLNKNLNGLLQFKPLNHQNQKTVIQNKTRKAKVIEKIIILTLYVNMVKST